MIFRHFDVTFSYLVQNRDGVFVIVPLMLLQSTHPDYFLLLNHDDTELLRMMSWKTRFIAELRRIVQ